MRGRRANPSSYHLCCLHNITLHLQLATHKQLLRIRLTSNQFAEVCVAEDKRDGGFLALGRAALSNSAGLLEINIPRLFLAGVLECESEDSGAFLDCVFAVSWRGGERTRYFVEGGRGGEVGWRWC